ncbi:uncharacterized protein LOC116337069 [Contarinia nasturtii]|uniref:uncharacterized protein LOC116337069 n=1 Tax=Contarinia nasturtii TaxID=265458 RepID=UPI0012D4432F|nr:uncharacterized protein LOC116337069 [Contarinia nasturtii]
MAIQSNDILWIFAVGAVCHINFVNAILYQNIDVLPSANPLPISFLHPSNSPVLAGFTDNNLVTTNDYQKFNHFGYYNPQTLSTIYPTVKSPNDVFDDSLYGYYHNGRFLKQYFVSEENVDDINALNSFLSRFMPFVPANYNVPASKLPNLGFPTIPTIPTSSPTVAIQNNPINDFYSINSVRVAPLPVQLGSGSLGYVRLPNGAVYLGSGSLGYTNERLKTDELNEVRNRQSPQASPLHFVSINNPD